MLVVPKGASQATILGSAKFRSRGRLPALSYFHKDTKVSANLGLSDGRHKFRHQQCKLLQGKLRPLPENNYFPL